MTAFLAAESRRLAPKTAQRLATALRSLLRFWHVQGLISGPLDRAVPKVANRLAGASAGPGTGQVQACWPRATGRPRLGAGIWRC